MQIKLLDIKQVAEELGVKTSTVRRAIYSDGLKYHKIGRLIRISEADLEAWIRSKQVNSEGKDVSEN